MIFNSIFLKIQLQGLTAGIIAVNVVVTFAVVAEIVLVILQERNWQKKWEGCYKVDGWEP